MAAHLTLQLVLAFIMLCRVAATIVTRDIDLPDKQLDSTSIRTIYGNDTITWEADEGAVIRVLSDQVREIVFNCMDMAEVCVRASTLMYHFVLCVLDRDTFSAICVTE